jgi:tetratricopeptide (TPR) repeat protein
LRGFNRTLAIDSTYHLAYSHLVQLYNNAATGNGPIIQNDSAFFVDSATLARLGRPRYDALRAEARRKGIDISKAWARADDQSTQGYYQLAQSYGAAGLTDSAIIALKQGLSRPRSGAALARIALLQFQEIANDTASNGTLAYILERFTPDSLHELSVGTRYVFQGSLLSSAAMRGSSSDVDRAAKLYAASDPTLPFSTVSSAKMVEYFKLAHHLALGDSMTPAAKKTLLAAGQWMDSLPAQIRSSSKVGTASVPYLAFLITHDTLFRQMAGDWYATQPGGLPELDAIIALDRGDTASAMTLARGFTVPDSLRKSRFGVGGMRSVARGEVLERLGLTRQAAETYAATSPDRINRNGIIEPGLAVWVRSLLAQGRLWAKLGEREKAIAAYEEFLRRWKDADGSAAKQVAQARSELAALRDAPKGR